MKYIIIAFSIGIVSLLFSCHPKERKTIISKVTDSTKNTAPDAEKIDSIRIDSILHEATGIAAAKQDSRFQEKYVVTLPDSSSQVEVHLSSDYYFTKAHPHIIIKRYAPYYTYINIFVKTDKGLQQVASNEIPYMQAEYTGDTILDINGDHLKDFVVNWYGSNGCCLKAFSDVYLLRPDEQSFSQGFEFINPTFSPKEQIIRGVCYGHPGQTEMYKYKWNGEAVDTLEYIYYEKNEKDQKTGKLIVSNKLPDSDNYKVLRRLSAIPAEYNKIDGIDWFKGR